MSAQPRRGTGSVLRVVFGAILYFGFAFVSPVALVAAPLGLLLLFQRPARGEALLAAGLLALAAWSVTSPGDGFGRFEGAWVCLLAGGTVVALAVRPPSKAPFLGGALVAVAVAAAAGLLLVAVTPFSWHELRWLADRHFGMQARLAQETLVRALGGVEGGAEVLASLEVVFDEMVDLVGRLLPGFVLLQSLAALAAAWALYRRLARHPEGEPLPALRDFRFSDHLIWGVVVALVALVVPGTEFLRTVGGNLAAFFGGLYVLRGLGIVVAMAAAAGMGGMFAALLAAMVIFFLLPLVMFAALALGVSDTWVDWRKLALRAKDG